MYVLIHSHGKSSHLNCLKSSKIAQFVRHHHRHSRHSREPRLAYHSRIFLYCSSVSRSLSTFAVLCGWKGSFGEDMFETNRPTQRLRQSHRHRRRQKLFGNMRALQPPEHRYHITLMPAKRKLMQTISFAI